MADPTENVRTFGTDRTSGSMLKYRVVRNDRTPLKIPPAVGSVVYPVSDEFNLAHDDSRYTGIEYVAVSADLSKDYYFTMPLSDLEPT